MPTFIFDIGAVILGCCYDSLQLLFPNLNFNPQN